MILSEMDVPYIDKSTILSRKNIYCGDLNDVYRL